MFVDARGDKEDGGGEHAGRAVLGDCIAGLLREERVLTLTLCEAASAVHAEPKTRFVSIAFATESDAHYFQASLHELVYGPASWYPPGMTFCLARVFGRCCVSACLEVSFVQVICFTWLVYIALLPIVVVVALCTPRPPKRRTAPPTADTTYTTTNPAITGADRAV